MCSLHLIKCILTEQTLIVKQEDCLGGGERCIWINFFAGHAMHFYLKMTHLIFRIKCGFYKMVLLHFITLPYLQPFQWSLSCTVDNQRRPNSLSNSIIGIVENWLFYMGLSKRTSLPWAPNNTRYYEKQNNRSF